MSSTSRYAFYFGHRVVFIMQTMACCRAAALPEQCMRMCDLRGTLQQLANADIMVVAEWYEPIYESTFVLSVLW